jgi:multiple sugar transport system permease protein
MIIPFLVSIFHIYLLRQTFKQIPNELYYAAKVDGCKDYKYLWKIMVPMAKSSIVTIVILKLMGAWNAYIWPDIVANEKYKLVTTWLRTSFTDAAETGMGRVLINYQMAATVIVTVPLLLMFVFFRKYIMSGVSRSGVKG